MKSASRSTTVSIRPVSTAVPLVRWVSDRLQRATNRAEGAQIHIAERDQALAGDDEGHRRRFRRGQIALVEHRRGHEMGAVLLIEPARRLDLLLLFARRHVELERALDLGLLLRRGVEEVDPHRLLGDPGLAGLREEHPLAGLVDGEHRTLPGWPRAFDLWRAPETHRVRATIAQCPAFASRDIQRPGEPQFFCKMQAPPAARRRAQSVSASPRLSAPIWTMYR